MRIAAVSNDASGVIVTGSVRIRSLIGIEFETSVLLDCSASGSAANDLSKRSRCEMSPTTIPSSTTKRCRKRAERTRTSASPKVIPGGAVTISRRIKSSTRRGRFTLAIFSLLRLACIAARPVPSGRGSALEGVANAVAQRLTEGGASGHSGSALSTNSELNAAPCPARLMHRGRISLADPVNPQGGLRS